MNLAGSSSIQLNNPNSRFDLEAAVEKTIKYIKEAAENGAELVAFPECWIPGYPVWIWDYPVNPPLLIQYIRNALNIDSPQMSRICSGARESQIYVVLGFSESDQGSLYMAQAIISPAGEIVMHRRKMKPTHMERTIFGEASGDCLANVVATPFGNVGALNCWEHLQPLLKYHTYSQRENIHVAAWPPLFSQDEGTDLYSMTKEGCRVLSQAYSMEGQCFTLYCTQVLGQSGIDKNLTTKSKMWGKPGGGSSAVIAPDGSVMTENLAATEEGIVYAEINHDLIALNKSFVDLIGHYSRPDLFTLVVDDRTKPHVVYRDEGGKALNGEKVGKGKYRAGGVMRKVDRED